MAERERKRAEMVMEVMVARKGTMFVEGRAD